MLALRSAVYSLLARDFLKLVIVAILIASPFLTIICIAGAGRFAYRIDIQVIFAVCWVGGHSPCFFDGEFSDVRAA